MQNVTGFRKGLISCFLRAEQQARKNNSMDALEWFFAANGIRSASQGTFLELVTQCPLHEMKELVRWKRLKWRGVRRYFVFLSEFNICLASVSRPDHHNLP